MLLWFKAMHIIAMVAWFAALFYLPRLFVYHADATDEISTERFNVMERRLYFGIMWPAAIATTLFGLLMLWLGWAYYKHAAWLHAKLALVVVLWGYHGYCGYCRKLFAAGMNHKTAYFYRMMNEFPTLLLILIVVLVVVKPF